MKNTAVRAADILLPAGGVSPEKWAVVAVDQFTSQPEYWREAEQIVADAPSTLKMTLPEVYLAESETRVPEMQATMRRYLADGVLETGVRDGYILVERSTESGARLGLMACLDLEAYDYTAGSQSLIRATEGTVIERVPPRVKIRRGAPVELPHVLMLMDDVEARVIEPLYARRNELRRLYDFELMLGGGHLRGWAVEGAEKDAVEAALDQVYAESEGLFLAVGDGNHSLAAARAYWLELRDQLPEAARAKHPARYALAELENLHSPVLQFEPIHRVLTGVNPAAVLDEYEAFLRSSGETPRPGTQLRAIGAGLSRSYGFDHHPLKQLQAFLDRYLADHPEAAIDYIHGDAALRQLVQREDALGLMPCAFEKAELFPFIREYGVLPRKTFSMGHAQEKRYYFEARKIEAE